MKVGFSSEALGLKILLGFNSNHYSSGQVYYPIWLLNKLNSQPQRLPLVLLIRFHMGKNHPWISSDHTPFCCGWMQQDFVFPVWDITHRAPQLCGSCWFKSTGSEPACVLTILPKPPLDSRAVLKPLCSHPWGYNLSPSTLSSSPSWISASYSAEWWGHFPHPTHLLTLGKWRKTL